MDKPTKKLLEIHTAVFLFGLSALFGKLITLPAIIITLGRVFFATISLFCLILIKKKNLKLKSKNDYYIFLLLGLILTLHWWSFFYSIQISTITIALLTYSTFPIFTIFLEPLFFKEKLKLKDIIIALITFLGIFLILPEFELKNKITLGIIFGVLSGFTFTILQILNKKYVQVYSPEIISFYQFCTASILLIPFLFIMKIKYDFYNIILLAILGIIFTAISHTLFIKSLLYIKVKTASIIASLEPIYGILAAIIILNEIPNQKEIIGGILIISMSTYVSIKNKENY